MSTVVNVFLIKGGPMHLTDIADPTNTKDLVTEGTFVTASYDPIKNTLSFSDEQTTNSSDAFYAAIVANAANLCQ